MMNNSSRSIREIRGTLCPLSCRHLRFLHGFHELTTIGDWVDCRYGTLTSSVDFTGLTSLTSIGEHFMQYCASLTSVDFTGLASLTSIGNSFMGNCGSLPPLDFTGLTSLTSISDYFMNQCRSLTSVDF